ncbi:MAG TPA: flagellar protein export ATPase FliI, partial [Thermoanaerobacterales bacterium]|nr:flagellar protein export ATPase FliI [Thermoanaerobacterales bacterium]
RFNCQTYYTKVELGEICEIHTQRGENILAEVVGFKGDRVLLMPLGEINGLKPGCEVVKTGKNLQVKVGDMLTGRILDGLGNPIDDKGPLVTDETYPILNNPPHPLNRKRIDTILSLGIKAIDGLLTCGKGQRMGIFSGSGVGKSVLMGMIARNAVADINVIALIGERGREVKEFLEKDLGEEGLKRSIVVVATSDQPALIRVKGAYVATAIAEYFRDQGKNVILLMDSLTRFSMALREIGLAVGEPPVSRGYTPSVFATLPKLLERAGTSDKGSIAGFYTVLVDGDDFDEPITDAVRGILDGHIILSRKLANTNHYPAIDVLGSISRLMIDIIDEEHKEQANYIKDLIATYKEAEDLINIGAYNKGSNPKIDLSIKKIEKINDFLTQNISENVSLEDTLEIIKQIAS